MAMLIESWEDLAGLENDDYYLEIDLNYYNGWIRSKADDDFYQYLSTHTFYGEQYQYYTKKLQECGFDVQLNNWDEKAKRE